MNEYEELDTVTNNEEVKHLCFALTDYGSIISQLGYEYYNADLESRAVIYFEILKNMQEMVEISKKLLEKNKETLKK